MFAGIELDCSRNEARLPHEKVEKRQFAWEEESYTERAPISYWLNEFCMLGGNSREIFLRRLINLTLALSIHIISYT